MCNDPESRDFLIGELGPGQTQDFDKLVLIRVDVRHVAVDENVELVFLEKWPGVAHVDPVRRAHSKHTLVHNLNQHWRENLTICYFDARKVVRLGKSVYVEWRIHVKA